MDAPASMLAAARLVVDLDLWVAEPDGTRHTLLRCAAPWQMPKRQWRCNCMPMPPMDGWRRWRRVIAMQALCLCIEHGLWSVHEGHRPAAGTMATRASMEMGPTQSSRSDQCRGCVARLDHNHAHTHPTTHDTHALTHSRSRSPAQKNTHRWRSTRRTAARWSCPSPPRRSESATARRAALPSAL